VSHPVSGEPAERVGDGQHGPQDRAGEIPRTKTALAHNGLIAGAIVLILLLV